MPTRLGRLSVLCLAVIVALGMCVCVVSAAPKTTEVKLGTGTITGVVTDAKGKAVAGAPLWLVRDGELVMEVRTDKDGKYSLKDVPAGKFDLVIGSEMRVKMVTAADSQLRVLNLVLPGTNYSAAAWPTWRGVKAWYLALPTAGKAAVIAGGAVAVGGAAAGAAAASGGGGGGGVPPPGNPNPPISP